MVIINSNGRNLSSAIIRSRFRSKFYFKWTFYGKLILKRYLDAEDGFRDRAAVQRKIPLRMDFKNGLQL